MKTFRASDVRIFRPYPDEVPWELLAAAGVDEQVLAPVLDLDFLRVAKYQRRVTGAYGIRPHSAARYELVVLIVAEGFRGKGLGRWLLGHAIGLAETKGGREIVTCDRSAERFLVRFGFEPEGAGLRLVLTPE